MASSASWEKIFNDYKILEHDFTKSPFFIDAKMIKKSVQDFEDTSDKEVRILCKIDSREKLPEVMANNNLFLLPIKNGSYVILKGNCFLDIPEITSEPIEYLPKLSFDLKSSFIGSSEMQHLDYCFAISMVRTFCKDDNLVLTIRGRKYTPKFDFNINNYLINVESVQTEVDAGYESENKIVLIEAKNSKTKNINIRQLLYPFKQWSLNTGKEVMLIFFEKRGKFYNFWQYRFSDPNDFNSIELVESKRYIVRPSISSVFKK